MFELATGDEHLRKLRIGPLGRWNDVGGYQFDAAVRSRKTVGEHNGLARVLRREAGIGHAALALQPLPGNATDGLRHGLAHFFIHRGHALLRAGVVPVQPHARGHLLDDPQVGSRIARRVERAPPQLHHAVGVGDGAGLLGPGARGQHHIGQPGGLGHENVLNHQMFQCAQRLPRVVQIGVAHGRVFALDIHAAYLVRIAVGRQAFVQDLDHGVAGLVVEPRLPERLEPRMRLRIADELVVRVHHGNETGVAGALHIVLPAQGMQPAAGLADLAGHAGQRDEAARVVGAVHMLADAHAPQNHGGLAGGEGAGHFADGLGRYAADRRHGLGAVALDVLLQRLEVAGALRDKLLIDQAFFDDGVNHGVEQGHVGIGAELQRAPGMAAEVGHARIGQHDFGAALGGVFHPSGRHRVIGRGVGADHQNELGMLHIVDLVAHRARAHPFEQRGHAGRMAQPGAVIDVVAAEAGAHQLLEQVGLFVAAFGRAETGQRLVAVAGTQVFELAGGEIERFFPGGLAEGVAPVALVRQQSRVFRHARLADQRPGQALRVVRVVEAKAAFDAQAAVVGGAIAALDADDDLVFHVVGDLAAHAAERADRIDPAINRLRADVGLGHERARGAGLHALAAGHAGAVAHGVVQVEHDFAVMAAKGVADDVVDLFFAAGAHAAVALNAGIEVDRHRRVRHVGRGLGAAGFPQRRSHLHALARGPVAEFAVRAGGVVAQPFVARLGQVGKQHFEHHVLALHRARAVGMHLHAGGRGAAAAWRQHALAVDLDHAGAAVAIGPVAGFVAQPGYRHTVAVGQLQQGFAFERLHRAAVEFKLDRLRVHSRHLVSKIGLHAAHRVGRRLSEAADGGVGHDLIQVFERGVIPLRSLHELRGLAGADAAGRALAAAFVLEKAHDVERGVAGPVLIAEHDDGCRANEAAMRLQGVEVERHIGQPRR